MIKSRKVSVYLTFGVIPKGGSVKTKFSHLGLEKLIIFTEIIKISKKTYFPSTTTIVKSSFWILPDLIMSSMIVFSLSLFGSE